MLAKIGPTPVAKFAPIKIKDIGLFFILEGIFEVIHEIPEPNIKQILNPSNPEKKKILSFIDHGISVML